MANIGQVHHAWHVNMDRYGVQQLSIVHVLQVNSGTIIYAFHAPTVNTGINKL